VLGFSIGLAVTMVTSGVIAAIGVRHLSKRADASGRFSALAAKAPYLSGGLIVLVGAVLAWQALRAMA
jgi:nickel/cobalt exporter